MPLRRRSEKTGMVRLRAPTFGIRRLLVLGDDRRAWISPHDDRALEHAIENRALVQTPFVAFPALQLISEAYIISMNIKIRREYRHSPSRGPCHSM
jgi:hypothetical protein